MLSLIPITRLFFYANFSTINPLNINSCCGALMPPACDLSQKLRHYSATWLCVWAISSESQNHCVCWTLLVERNLNMGQCQSSCCSGISLEGKSILSRVWQKLSWFSGKLWKIEWNRLLSGFCLKLWCEVMVSLRWMFYVLSPVFSISGRFHFFLVVTPRPRLVMACLKASVWISTLKLTQNFWESGQAITACQPSCRKLQNAKELRELLSSKLWEDRVCICGWPLNCTPYIHEQCGLACPQLNSNNCFSLPFPLIQKAGTANKTNISWHNFKSIDQILQLGKAFLNLITTNNLVN